MLVEVVNVKFNRQVLSFLCNRSFRQCGLVGFGLGLFGNDQQ
jgi:hypothetical protein